MLLGKLKDLCAGLRGSRRHPAAPAATVRPTLDVLEDRTVPSTVVADFNGQGLFRYDTPSQTWQQINGNDPSAMAVDSATGDVVATFPGYGTALWTAGSGGWTVLTGAEATVLSMAGSDQNIVGEFPGYGVWAFHPNTGWLQLTAADASVVATDAAGNVAGEFPGNGVWYFSGPDNAWTQMTPADASQLVMGDVGFVVGQFDGYGVWAAQYGGDWSQLTGADAESLTGSGAGGLVGASFYGYGTYAYDPNANSWNLLTTDTGDSLATDGADFAGVFWDGYCQVTSFYDYYAGGWTQIGSQASLLGVGAD
jgi:hypothetical protein